MHQSQELVFPLDEATAAQVCDLDYGLWVAARATSPVEGALAEEYRRTYKRLFGYEPAGLHLISVPGNTEGLPVLFHSDHLFRLRPPPGLTRICH